MTYNYQLRTEELADVADKFHPVGRIGTWGVTVVVTVICGGNVEFVF